MAHITSEEAEAWTEPTKVGGDILDDAFDELEPQIASQILARLSARFDTSTWIDENSTPMLVRSIIAMYYVSYVYDKTYSTDDDLSEYAELLRRQADLNLQGLIEGNIDLPEVPEDGGYGSPAFYPTDASSAAKPTPEDPSLGPAAFSMGSVF